MVRCMISAGPVEHGALEMKAPESVSMDLNIGIWVPR